MQNRKKWKKVIDFITFPGRAITLFEEDKFGLSSLRSERFDYVLKEAKIPCLDVGCGRENLFISKWMGGGGVGVDVFAYKGLKPENILKDLTHLPFDSGSFETVTFIANINHVPESLRDAELKEANRCLRAGGSIVVTMGNPIAEWLVHKVVFIYDLFFGTHFDMDSERGMHPEEKYFLLDGEIIERLKRAGFLNIKKKYFWTQWGLNHLFVGRKGKVRM